MKSVFLIKIRFLHFEATAKIVPVCYYKELLRSTLHRILCKHLSRKLLLCRIVALCLIYKAKHDAETGSLCFVEFREAKIMYSNDIRNVQQLYHICNGIVHNQCLLVQLQNTARDKQQLLRREVNYENTES